MNLTAIQTAIPGGEGFNVYVPKPFLSTSITIGGKGADVPLAGLEKGLLALSASEDGLLVEPRSCEAEVNGKPLRHSKTLKPGDRLSLGGRSFGLVERGGWVLYETGQGKVAEGTEQSLWGSGFEVFHLPFGMNIRGNLSEALEGLRERLHLNGATLLHHVPGQATPIEYSTGAALTADKSAALTAARSEMLFLSSSPALSVAATGHHWPDGSHSVLLAWADRPLSVGYLANLYNHLPEVLSSLAISRETERLMEKLSGERLASVGMLAAGMSHILNNIFGAVYGYAQLAKTRDEFVPRLIETAIASTARARELLQVLTNLSPHEARERRRVNVGNALKDVIALAEAEAARRGVHIVLDIVSPNAAVYADPADVYQMLLALALDSLENTERDKTLAIRLETDGAHVVLTLAEPARSAERAANGSVPETRKPAASEESFLMVEARRLAGALGGTVASREVSRVAERRARIPVVREESAASGDAKEDARQTGKQPAILIVDDEADYQKLVAYALRPEAADCASTADAAIALLAERRYRAVILDLVLGGSTKGDDVYAYLTQKAPDTKIVIVTGVTLKEEDRKRYEKAVAILNKPFDIVELRAALGM